MTNTNSFQQLKTKSIKQIRKSWVVFSKTNFYLVTWLTNSTTVKSVFNDDPGDSKSRPDLMFAYKWSLFKY